MKQFIRLLRLMWVINRECFMHPFCTSVIDTETMEVVARY